MNLASNLLKQVQNSERTFLILAAAVIGVLSGFGVILFCLGVEYFTRVFFDGGKLLLGSVNGCYVVFLPAAGGLIVGWLARYFGSDGKGYGVAEIMAAVAFRGGKVRFPAALVKSLASAICIGSGGSAGLQGPSVHIGGAVGSLMGQLIRIKGKRLKALAACGTAGGIAATFNAPIGGALFAMEVILGEVGGRYVSLSVISAVTASVVSRMFLGNEPAFAAPGFTLYSPYELLFYALLGVAAGIASIAYIRLMFKCEDVFNGLKQIPPFLRPAVGGLLVGCIGYFYPQVLGVGYDGMESALAGKMAFELMAALVILKMVCTSITLGSGGLGGVFAPALFIGAMLGGTMGVFFNGFSPEIAVKPAAYTLVGMGAVFAGSAQAPMTAIITLFEMSGHYSIILPLMVSCVISAVFVRAVNHESIYTSNLLRRNLDIEKAMRPDILKNIPVEMVMCREVQTIPVYSTVQDALKLASSGTHQGFPLIDKKGDLVGMVTLRELRKEAEGGKGAEPVQCIKSRLMVTVTPEDSLAEAAEKMNFYHVGRLPVVSRENPKNLIGILTRSDIIEAYGVYKTTLNNKTNQQVNQNM